MFKCYRDLIITLFPLHFLNEETEAEGHIARAVTRLVTGPKAASRQDCVASLSET
jgi:hypothetical protein